ncbi:hypothetical protein DFH09DRAFT_1383109 [Mycena vulgaris]|nr:hypothetical protein DFH09DRAFT_1383109 [Mycena vulgaris]
MPMQLRSTTRNMVPIPSSASDSTTGSVEMDAPMGTSTGNGELENEGPSAKSHSSSQYDADEPGHRSRFADVGDNHSRSNADVVSASHSVTPENGGAVSDGQASSGPAASQNGGEDPNVVFYGTGPDPQGFSTPKRSSRAYSARSASPSFDTSPKIFGNWFPPDDADKSSRADGVSAPQDWADSTHADGPGEIPLSWIKQESESIKLSWSPVDNAIDLSFDSLMREIAANMTPEDKENMVRRNAKLRNARLKPAKSVSVTTSEIKSKASSGSIHAVHGKDHATAAKGKGRDYTTAPSIDYSDGYVSEEETADDAARLHQLQADAILAMKLQKQMNSEGHAQEDSIVLFKVGPV